MPQTDPTAPEMVYMRHGDLEGVAGPVSRKAFDSVWSQKGWAEVPEDEATSAQAQRHEETVLDTSTTETTETTKSGRRSASK